jgi:DNA mismatch endonuclease (patch repair protein)
MQAVKSENTQPEMVVRRLAHRMGFRFRLHRKDLPGKPDLVFPKLRKVIFVNGCFWHGHDCRRGARVPVQNRAYWKKKVSRNRYRDKAAHASLQKLGWKVLVVWECELKKDGTAETAIEKFLSAEPSQ